MLYHTADKFVTVAPDLKGGEQFLMVLKNNWKDLILYLQTLL